MKKFTKAVLIIALICSLFGVVLCTIGVASGTTWNDIRNAVEDGRFSWHDWGWNWNGNDDPGEETTGTETSYYEASQIQDLELSIQAGVLKIKESEDSRIRVDAYTKRGSVDTKQDGNTLSVLDKTSHYWTDSRVEITLYLPKNASFDFVDIDVEAGFAESELDAIYAEEATVNVDAGRIELKGLVVREEVSLSVGAGEMKITDLDAGGVTIDTGIGHMSLTGKVNGDITADCGIGELVMKLNAEQRDYNYSIECGIGEIRIGEDRYSGLSEEQTASNQTEYDMNLECGIGSIKINFENESR